MLLISFCDFISSANSWFLLFPLFLRDFKNKYFCVFRFLCDINHDWNCNFDFSLFLDALAPRRAFNARNTIHFSLKNAMTQETKNKWSVIINAILTTLTALLSAFGLAWLRKYQPPCSCFSEQWWLSSASSCRQKVRLTAASWCSSPKSSSMLAASSAWKSTSRT